MFVSCVALFLPRVYVQVDVWFVCRLEGFLICFSFLVFHLVCEPQQIAAAQVGAGPQLAVMSLLSAPGHYLPLAGQTVSWFNCRSRGFISPAFLSYNCGPGQLVPSGVSSELEVNPTRSSGVVILQQ